VPLHDNEGSWKSRAAKKYLYFASVVERSSDGKLLMFHLQIHLFALNITLSEFVYLKKFKTIIFMA
jgi:hypothetical protein